MFPSPYDASHLICDVLNTIYYQNDAQHPTSDVLDEPHLIISQFSIVQRLQIPIREDIYLRCLESLPPAVAMST